MKPNVISAVNQQIQAEYYSSYLYLAMAAYSETLHLSGFAQWLKAQAAEEQAHAMKLFNHLVERDAPVELLTIKQPPQTFKSSQGIFEAVLAHEQKVTGLIHALNHLAVNENDEPLQALLKWFLKEQIEEEDSAGKIVAQIAAIQDKKLSFSDIDAQLGTRR